MKHDPLCPHKPFDPDASFQRYEECQCDFIAKVRADERRWVLSSAGRQVRFHVVKDGVCACTINAPDPLEHLAWIVEDYMFTLLPEHETFDWKKKHGQIDF